MWLKQKNQEFHFFKRLKHRNLFLVLLILFLMAGSLLTGAYTFMRFWQRGEIINLSYIRKTKVSLVTNWLKSFTANPEKITIDIKHKDFQKLAYFRDLALERGAIIVGKDFSNRFKGAGEIRILKWSGQ